MPVRTVVQVPALIFTCKLLIGQRPKMDSLCRQSKEKLAAILHHGDVAVDPGNLESLL